MPSWSALLLPRSKSTKQSSSSSSSSSSISSLSSLSSTPVNTPNSSTIWYAPASAAQSTSSVKRRSRWRKQHQPKPITPRLTSLFFPSSTLTPEQEVQCVYRATHASCSDLLGGNRPVSGFWAGDQQSSQSTSLDLGTSGTSTPYALPSLAHSTGNLDILITTHSETQLEDPYQALAPRYPANRRVQRKSVDYTSMMARMERSQSSSGAGEIERGTEIWSSPYDSDSDLPSSALNMPPPPVPARSTLRPTASASNLRDRSKAGSSTPFTLSVDPLPLPSTSTLSPSLIREAPSVALPPVTPPTSTSTESGFSIGRRRRPNIGVRGGSISGDPNRVKDGAAAKESTSGVYTPPTFPGVSGHQAKPTPSQSRVYTPASFTLPSPSTNRAFPPASPSRSTSVSSTSTTSSFGEVTTPRTPHTPLTPSGRFLGAVSGGWGSAVTGIKRASATLSTRSLSSPSASSSHAYTPTSAREGYFPSTIYEAGAAKAGSVSAGGTPLAPSLWPTSPGTPGSAAGGKPYGLGLGLGSEDLGTRRSRSDTGPTAASSEKFGGVLVGDVPKGKRKPVPKPAGSEEIKEEDEAEIVHAL